MAEVELLQQKYLKNTCQFLLDTMEQEKKVMQDGMDACDTITKDCQLIMA